MLCFESLLIFGVGEKMIVGMAGAGLLIEVVL